MAAVVLNLLTNFVALILMVGVASLTSTWALLKGFKPRNVVLASMATLVIVAGFLLAFNQFSLHQDLLVSLHKMFDDYWSGELQKMVEAKMTQEEIGLAQMVYQLYIFQAFPAWIAVNSLVVGILAYYFSSSILSRITPRVPQSMAFRLWVVPEPLVFGLILGGLVKVFSTYFKEWPWVDVAGNNLLVFFAVLYAIGGLSILMFFLGKLRLFGVQRYLVIFLALWTLLLFGVMFPVCLVLGILDVWFDFRKLKVAQTTTTA